ncbi:MAG: hypothetical protein ACRC1H_04935 [Caldilineaceae bacterium]
MQGLANLRTPAAQQAALNAALAPTLEAKANSTPVSMPMPTSGTLAQQTALTSALAPTMAATGGMLQDARTRDVRNAVPPAVAGAPAPQAAPAAAPAPTAQPPQAAAPAAAPKDNFDKQVQLAALVSKQNNSRTPVSDPYAPVPGSTAAPAAGGMPAPGGVVDRTPDLNGTPAQQTAYWAQQKAGLQERERYADQQNQQQTHNNMMQADQDFKREMFEFIKANGEKLGPATLGALSQMSGQHIGANQPASAGVAAHASMANHMGQLADAAAKNNLTARGQDLTYAGHQLTGNNDMAKARLNADVSREGHANQAAIHAASNTSAEARNAAVVAADRERTAAQLEAARAAHAAFKPVLDGSRLLVNGQGLGMQPVLVTPKKKEEKKPDEKK